MNILINKIGQLLTNRLRNIMFMLVIGILILVIRNPDPLFNLVVYTEDGQWIGRALSNGWLDTFINAKDGYFVWGNLTLLWASVNTSEVICSNSLRCLPQGIAFYSYLTFSSLAVLVFFSTRNAISKPLRFFLYFLVLMIPLGDSANEVIGRISNVGFVAVLAGVLILHCKSSINGRIHSFLIDAFIIFLAGTNPVVIPVIVVCISLKIITSSNTSKTIKNNVALFLGLLLLSCWIYIRISSLGQSSVTGELQLANLIEVGVARSILYPFIFPIYSKLNDFIVLVLFLCWLGGIIYSISKLMNKKTRELMFFLCTALVIYLIFTLYARQSLTQQLGGYLTTFPDRYFLGLNLLVIVISLIAINELLISTRARKRVGIVAGGIVLSIYLFSTPWLFEIKSPRLKIKNGFDFADQLCLSSIENNPDVKFINIPIYFSGWLMTVPSSYVFAAAQQLDCTSFLNTPLKLTDVNWNKGVALNWPGIVVVNSNYHRYSLIQNDFIKFPDGSTRKIIRKEANGMYLNVFLNGDLLNPEIVGYPNKFEVLK